MTSVIGWKKILSMSTICMQPSCIYWVSITRSSPSVFKAASTALPTSKATWLRTYSLDSRRTRRQIYAKNSSWINQKPKKYRSDSDCPTPSNTPVIPDGKWIDTWPQANDPPARNLFTGDNFAGAMVRLTLPRHGSNNRWGRNQIFNPKDDLPGAINIGFVDGHSQMVRLENLWKLDWNKNWVPP